jgi:hypothetical protein
MRNKSPLVGFVFRFFVAGDMMGVPLLGVAKVCEDFQQAAKSIEEATDQSLERAKDETSRQCQ